MAFTSFIRALSAWSGMEAWPSLPCRDRAGTVASATPGITFMAVPTWARTVVGYFFSKTMWEMFISELTTG